MKYIKKYSPHILVLILFLSSIFIWYLIYKEKNKTDYLTVAYLDVGQGDSIFIEAPNGKQMLIDSGLNGEVLGRLGEVMHFGDRSIDIVLETHADLDHIGGMPLVLDNYKVGNVIRNGVGKETEIYKDLEDKILKKKIKKIIAHRGMRIILDEKRNIYFDILFPDRDVSQMESNDGSVVGKLSYGDQSFMFMGDATIYTENIIGWNENHSALDSDVLKLGHHGSKTSSGILWLEEVDPEVAIISVDKNNRYGHPHAEVLERLDSLGIKYLYTYEKGNVIFKTDGQKLIY